MLIDPPPPTLIPEMQKKPQKPNPLSSTGDHSHYTPAGHSNTKTHVQTHVLRERSCKHHIELATR